MRNFESSIESSRFDGALSIVRPGGEEGIGEGLQGR